MPVQSEWGTEWTRLRVLDLGPGEAYGFGTGECEWIVLPLSGACEVDCRDLPGPEAAPQVFPLHGRSGVFDAVSDFAYLPRDARAEVRSAAGGGSRSPVRAARRGSRRATARPRTSPWNCGA